MNRIVLLVCVAFAMALAAPRAHAEPPEKAEKAAKKAAKKAPERCKKGETRTAQGCAKEVDFKKGDDIDGESAKNYGDFLTAAGKALFGGLIRVRQNFHAEILRSADAI